MVEGVGKISLADITLIEDPNEEDRTDGELLNAYGQTHLK